MTAIEPGLIGTAEEIVTEELTAARWHSGLVAAFATPALVAIMENAAFEAVRAYLEPGQTTVGVSVEVEHLAATPVGMKVRARAELIGVDARRLRFKVEAWDEVDLIGRGMHTRAIVDLNRFERRLEEKSTRATA